MQRGWMEHPALKDIQFSKPQAWTWLIEKAVFKDTVIEIVGNPITLKRGQLSYSLHYLEAAWGWDVNKVRRFIKKLKKWQMIDTETDRGQHVITICNYNKYQGGRFEGDIAANQNPTIKGQRSDNNKKEVKELKNKKRFSSLEEMKASKLDGAYADWFHENAPDINRFQIREDVISYCEANGKIYKDYWAAMRSFASKQQQAMSAKKPQTSAEKQVEMAENKKIMGLDEW